MKKIVAIGLLLMLVLGFTIPVSAAPLYKAKTYTVLVGAENIPQGIGVMSFFPGTLSIHVGDTVVWKANSHEIHTVTFLAGTMLEDFVIPAPPNMASPLQINPKAAFPVPPQGGAYDGSTYANSGILSTDPGQALQYSLTFTKQGSFPYVCFVHGMMMSGTINVVGNRGEVESPSDVSEQASHQVAVALAKGRALIGTATAQVPAPIHNPDGTTTRTVLIGFSKASTELMRFFPSKLVVHPGDTVNFMLSQANDAPHTVTFLNGHPDIPLVVPVPNPPGPPILLFNSQVLFPINPGVALNATDIFSSGFLAPGGGPNSFTLKIGKISGSFNYECLLHDTSGMMGVIKVVP
ncbi:MAG: plastocyanin/azurin family copper-binding protein [Anaerolineaceae bacterium]|nr:plastocyanin/azurin family copper-binding protein [Anaerolineaceae bacterium]